MTKAASGRHGESFAAGLSKWRTDHSPPSQEDLRKVTNDCIKLYLKDLPPKRILVSVAPFDIDDVVLEPSKIAEVVRRLKNGKASALPKLE